jgi:hypothetical protein
VVGRHQPDNAVEQLCRPETDVGAAFCHCVTADGQPHHPTRFGAGRLHAFAPVDIQTPTLHASASHSVAAIVNGSKTRAGLLTTGIENPVSDNVLSIIPTDPQWQPEQTAADRAAAIIAELAPGDPDGVDVDINIDWHDTITVIDCGANLERIGCPTCGASIDTRWWGDLLEERHENGFDDLTVTVPCCGATTRLEALTYEWPCGFARFEIAIWNPGRGWFTDQEITAVADALGHPVRQVMAHI